MLARDLRVLSSNFSTLSSILAQSLLNNNKQILHWNYLSNCFWTVGSWPTSHQFPLDHEVSYLGVLDTVTYGTGGSESVRALSHRFLFYSMLLSQTYSSVYFFVFSEKENKNRIINKFDVLKSWNNNRAQVMMETKDFHEMRCCGVIELNSQEGILGTLKGSSWSFYLSSQADRTCGQKKMHCSLPKAGSSLWHVQGRGWI